MKVVNEGSALMVVISGMTVFLAVVATLIMKAKVFENKSFNQWRI